MKTLSLNVFGLLLAIPLLVPQMASAQQPRVDSLRISAVCGQSPGWDFALINWDTAFINQIQLISLTDSVTFAGAYQEPGTMVFDNWSDSVNYNYGFDTLTFYALPGAGISQGADDSGFYFLLGGPGGSPFTRFDQPVELEWISEVTNGTNSTAIDSGYIYLLPTIFQGPCSLDSVTDTIILDAPPGGVSTINLATNEPLSRHAIFIKNDTSVWIEPEMLQITDSNSYAYFNTVGTKAIELYDSIPPGDTSYFTPIIMTLDAPDTGTYNIDLSLSYEIQRAFHKTEITSSPDYQYHIVVRRMPASVASVNQPSQPSADFTVYPNPASGDVTISVPTGISSNVEIYDVLGNLVMSRQVDGPFVWNGESSAGTKISNGAYIVRVQEAGGDGQFATASKQLMYLR